MQSPQSATTHTYVIQYKAEQLGRQEKKSHYESEEEHVISFLVVRSGILHVEPY